MCVICVFFVYFCFSCLSFSCTFAAIITDQTNSVFILKFTLNHRCIFLQVLKDALEKLHRDGIKDPFYQPVHTYVLNPKVRIYAKIFTTQILNCYSLVI